MRPLFAEFFGNGGFVQLPVFARQHLFGVPEAVFVDLPFVPDMDVPLLQPAHVVRLRLIDPQHLEHRLPDKELLRGEDRKFFCKVEPEGMARHLYGIYAGAVVHPHALGKNAAAKPQIVNVPLRHNIRPFKMIQFIIA